MKKTLTILSFAAGVAGLHAQGTLNYQDFVQGQFQISVLSPTTSNPGVETQGNTSFDTPAGNTSYPGSVFLGGTTTGSGPTGYFNGNNYTIGVYEGTSQAQVLADVLSGAPVATTTFNTTYGDNNAGVWASSGLTAVDANLAPGTSVYVELAAWYSGDGSDSYAAAVAAGDPAGMSDISTSEAVLGGQGASGPPVTAPTMAGLGLTSFDLTTVPEPSTIALGIMGVSAFLIRRRK